MLRTSVKNLSFMSMKCTAYLGNFDALRWSTLKSRGLSAVSACSATNSQINAFKRKYLSYSAVYTYFGEAGQPLLVSQKQTQQREQIILIRVIGLSAQLSSQLEQKQNPNGREETESKNKGQKENKKKHIFGAVSSNLLTRLDFPEPDPSEQHVQQRQ